ncbi:hypothetical protein AB0M43_26725 [Longispora sp. NPDC051575]|uniref:hypothetical protein n=1 Tax=Longispora sp. NPDC051575 TaxID=3154943 RepID=UPI0034450C5B
MVETRLRDHFQRGDTLVLAGPDPTAPGATPADWTPDQRIAAEDIVALLRGAAPAAEGRTAAVRITGALITGRLDLTDAEFTHPLELTRCWVAETVVLTDARTRALRFNDCRLDRVTAQGLVVDGPLEFEGAVATEIYLPDAQVKGTLSLAGATLTNPGGTTLRIDSTTIEADLHCSAREVDGRIVPFRSTGQLNLQGAAVRCSVYLRGAELTADPPTSLALYAENLTVGQNLACGGFIDLAGTDAAWFTLRGQATLFAATVSGAVLLEGAELSYPEGVVLDATHLGVGSTLGCGPARYTISCSVWSPERFAAAGVADRRCDEAPCPGHDVLVPFRADGGLRLADARVGGSVYLDAADLRSGTDGLAVNAERLSVEGALICRPFGPDLRPRIRGTLFLRNARLSALSVDGALLEAPEPGAVALDAGEITIGQSLSGVVLDGLPLEVRGQLQLPGARVGGSIALDGAQLLNPGGVSLFAERMVVEGHVFLRAYVPDEDEVEYFRSAGAILMYGAQINGALHLNGAILDNPGGVTLDGSNLTVGNAVICHWGGALIHRDDSLRATLHSRGRIDLSRATVSGDVVFDGAYLEGCPLWESHVALDATNTTIGGNLSFQSGLDGTVPIPFETVGLLALADARVGGSLTLAGALLTSPGGRTLDAERAVVTGALSALPVGELRFRSHGEFTLSGATVSGAVDLSYAELLAADRVDPAPEVPEGVVRESTGFALRADGLRADADVILAGGPDEPFEARGAVSLSGARIGGNLLLSGAVLDDPDGIALDATNITVARNVDGTGWAGAKLRVTGPVKMYGGLIQGNLILSGAELRNASRLAAFGGDRLTVEQSLFAHGLVCVLENPVDPGGAEPGAPSSGEGAFRLHSATVRHNAELIGAHFEAAFGPAALLDNLGVDGDLFLTGGWVAGTFLPLTCVGTLRLGGATVRGGLNLSAGSLTSADGPALAADNLTVGRDLYCGPWLGAGLTVTNGASLVGATVTGTLSLDAAVVTAEGTALDAANLTVGGDLRARHPFTVDGEVFLSGAVVGKTLDLSGATLRNRDAVAFSGQYLTIAGDLLCTARPAERVTDDGTVELRLERFTAEGTIRLDGARVVGTVDFGDAALSGGESRQWRDVPVLLDCARLEARTLRLRPHAAVGGCVDLIGARIGDLECRKAGDEVPLRLDGLTYDRLSPADLHPRLRGRWLRDAEGVYAAQPYEQLAAVYRRLGHPRWARLTLLRKHRELWKRDWRHPRRFAVQLWRGLQDLLIGYGYAPGRAVLWLIGAFAAGTAYFSAHPPQPVAEHHQAVLRPWLYALDALLPTSPFGHQVQFRPHGSGFWVWFSLSVLGWLLAFAVLPAITRSISRE